MFRQLIQFDLFSGNPFTFQNGEYSYPFAFTLPSNIPTSFENIYGKIRYSMTVVIGRQNKSDLEYQIPFTVNSIVDLNSIQEAQVEQDYHRSSFLSAFDFVLNSYWLDDRCQRKERIPRRLGFCSANPSP